MADYCGGYPQANVPRGVADCKGSQETLLAQSRALFRSIIVILLQLISTAMLMAVCIYSIQKEIYFMYESRTYSSTSPGSE
ncbi:unnamed protein product [Amoebophrya sp. A25]|nr:unnamed protein product [Amoebophrya sp. A25]|eukprot:GSA25T00025782001.1